ncbi:WXG100 family type VII secretion target, partial [Streptomyces shenzhenensis]|uniref:WXG100 family type VII secretion target n=1 Tax=Streptomyces shenzhenensis TaxID=943815 RepID=UPI0015F0DFB0
MPRPTDWHAIGLDSDPTPGEPDQIRALSTELNHLGSEARRISTAIDAVMNTAGDSVFVGAAADALREKVNGRLRGHIEDVAQSFESAASALNTWADKLVDLQSRADGALNSGRGLSEDDPDRETYAATARQAGTEHGEGAAAAAGSISGVSNIQLPISKCQVFWEAFQWLAIILIVPALIFGGPIALLALGVNLTLFIKTIVDFANGDANFLDLFLAGLGILAPTTKALPIFQIIKGVGTTAFAKGFANIARGTFQALRNLFTNGFRPTTLLLGLKDLVRLGSTWVYKGGLWVLDGIHNLPNVIGRGVNSLGLTVVQGFKAIPGFVRGLPETLSRGWQATKGWVGQEFGGTKWLRIFLPVDAAEIGQYGFARALRIGLFDRGVLGQHVFGAPITGAIGRTISSVPVDPRTVDALVDMPRIQLNEVRFGAGSGQSSIRNLDLHIPTTQLDVTSTLRPPSLNLGDVGAIAHRGNFGVHAARTVDALVDMPHVQLGSVRVENFGALGGHTELGVSAGATPTVTTASGLHVPASAGVPAATHGVTNTPVTAVSEGAHTTLTGLPPTPTTLTSHTDVLLPGGAHNTAHTPGGTVLTGTHATPPPRSSRRSAAT